MVQSIQKLGVRGAERKARDGELCRASRRASSSQPLALDQGLPLHKILIVPDRLSLTEVLKQFQQTHEDFAIIVNEYSPVVGLFTLNDVMSTEMGDLSAAWTKNRRSSAETTTPGSS